MTSPPVYDDVTNLNFHPPDALSKRRIETNVTQTGDELLKNLTLLLLYIYAAQKADVIVHYKTWIQSMRRKVPRNQLPWSESKALQPTDGESAPEQLLLIPHWQVLRIHFHADRR